MKKVFVMVALLGSLALVGLVRADEGGYSDYPEGTFDLRNCTPPNGTPQFPGVCQLPCALGNMIYVITASLDSSTSAGMYGCGGHSVACSSDIEFSQTCLHWYAQRDTFGPLSYATCYNYLPRGDVSCRVSHVVDPESIAQVLHE